jgi:hypothetical protein
VSFNSPKVVLVRIEAAWEEINNIDGDAKKALKNIKYEWLYDFK